MLIIGAGNLGLHVLDNLICDKYQGVIAFFDDKKSQCELVMEKYKILTTEDEVVRYFQAHGPDFLAAIGNNRLRARITERFEKLCGKPASLIAQTAYVSSLLTIKQPVIIQPFATVAHKVALGKGCVIHANSVIGHDVILGNYVSIATLSTLIGPCEIGDHTFIGTHCVVMPGITIGKNVIIGSGCVVRRDLKDYETFT